MRRPFVSVLCAAKCATLRARTVRKPYEAFSPAHRRPPGWVNPAAVPRGSRSRSRGSGGSPRDSPAQLPHQLLHLRSGVAPAHQKREQAALAHGNGNAGQLPGPLRRHGARLEAGVDSLLLERPANRVLRRVALNALREQIPEETRGSPAPRRAQRGILLGELAVVEQAADREPLRSEERRVGKECRARWGG